MGQVVVVVEGVGIEGSPYCCVVGEVGGRQRWWAGLVVGGGGCGRTAEWWYEMGVVVGGGGSGRRLEMWVL